MNRRPIVAIDLGAESCRVSLLRWRGDEPEITLLHRIPNSPYRDQSGSLRWPLRGILSELETGLRKAAVAAPEGIHSIAVDGWAVDYVRLGSNGKIVEEPYCYRDERTIAAKEKADQRITPEDFFVLTGVQPHRINTVYQLLADQAAMPTTAQQHQHRWLLLPEFILHWLGARPVVEYTNATHTGLLDLKTRAWSPEIFARLGLDIRLAPELVAPGTILGTVRGPLAEIPAFRDTQLIAPACHDTASAIAAIPGNSSDAAYIVCGTWSLVGAAICSPIITTAALAGSFTNLGAASARYCFHTSINGMWLLKQCIDHWTALGRPMEKLTFPSLTQAAATVDLPSEAIFPVDAPELLLPGQMSERIASLLHASTGVDLADTPGNEPAFARLIFNSLAARYACALDALEQLTGQRYQSVIVLGGGSQNALLLHLIGKATGRAIVAGHAEGSTLGNFALQLAATRKTEIQPWASTLAQASWRCA